MKRRMLGIGMTADKRSHLIHVFNYEAQVAGGILPPPAYVRQIA